MCKNVQEYAVIKAYLFGAMHDGWIRKSDSRYRICQKGTGWLEEIQSLLASLEYRSWIYREGKTRNVYVLESVAPIFKGPFNPSDISSSEEKKAYLRGFFDAEGGIPKKLCSKKYVQLAQKDYKKIALLKKLLLDLDILTGKIHNPSKRVDPNYWRIYVRRQSILKFVSVVGSWHPRKRAIFQKWMRV